MHYKFSWIYPSKRWKPDFSDEVDKFIEAAEKHVMMTQNNNEILCPCSGCKNYLAWKDATIIISHLIIRAFVKDYTVMIQKKKLKNKITWTNL